MTPMPYQVKAGSFLVIAPTWDEALHLFDSLGERGEVVIRDMDGRVIDVEQRRNKAEPPQA